MYTQKSYEKQPNQTNRRKDQVCLVTVSNIFCVKKKTAKNG